MADGLNDFWGKVFIRILRGRVSSPEWQATYPVLPESVSRSRCLMWAQLDSACGNNDRSFDLLLELGRLPVEWQIRISGRTERAWLEDERSYRHGQGLGTPGGAL